MGNAIASKLEGPEYGWHRQAARPGVINTELKGVA